MHDDTERPAPDGADAGDGADVDPNAGAEEADEARAREAAPEGDGDEEPGGDGGEEPEADAAPDGETALKDQLLRALAETENARRRARKDVEEARAYAISRFAQDLLGVADNLGRALESIPAERRAEDEAVKAIADGIEMTARELESVLGRHGITRIDPLGETFDYNLHQALFETADTDAPDGTVVQVAQVGYRIGDRLLRPAMVGVAKGGAAPAPEAADGEPADEEPEAGAEDGESGAPSSGPS